MFICMPKSKFIIQFFLEIFHCKESCNLIRLTAFWAITREPELCQIWDWWWNINNNIIFHFRLILRKTNDKIFLMMKDYFGVILGRFFPNLGKNKIFWKKRTSVFNCSNSLPSHQKSEKVSSWEECWTDVRIDRQTDRQTKVNLRPSVGQVSNC